MRAAVARLANTTIPERISEGEDLQDIKVAISARCPDLMLTDSMLNEVFKRLRNVSALGEARIFRVSLDESDRALLGDVGGALSFRTQEIGTATATAHEMAEACASLRSHGGSGHQMLAEALERMMSRSLVGAGVGAR